MESRYIPIEGEAFGVAWSIEKARMFTLGCLGNRSLADIPNPLLYRMKEKCLRFRFNIQYLTRNINDAPDCMFRKYGDGEDEEIDLEEVDMR